MSDEWGGVVELSTLSVLFTDLVGSTELRSRLGEDVAEVVRRAHDKLIADVIGGNGGRVVKGLGDGFLTTFGSAARAVAAAVAIQQGFDAQRFVEPHVELLIRIGISLGDVTIEAGDVFGTTVIEASRLCAAANGGQILATGVVAALARGRSGCTFTDVGALDLKGLPEPVPAVEVGWERVYAEVGIPYPPPLMVPEGAFPFSGREIPVDFMATLAKRAFVSSTTVCVLIAGEPGMGKTRLAAEFSQRAHDEGATVLFGRCDEELGISYQPFVEALNHFVAHLDANDVAKLGAHAVELTRLVPDIATSFGELGERTVAGDAEAEQYHLFEAVEAWLQSAAGASGLVLVLDDVHWAAKPTLLLLRHLLRSSTAARLLIVATYRDTDLDRTHPLADFLVDLRRFPEVQRLALSGLELDDIEELMVAVNGAALDTPGRELAAAVHAETDGNPFFVGELLRHLAETGAVVNDGDRWQAATAVSEMSLPDGVREVIGRRLSRLSNTTNEVLAWAAVMGRELRLDVLGRVAGGEDACLDALDEAVDALLVEEVGLGRWRFAHALVRSTLLAELRSTRKIRMHLTIGEAYEEFAPDDLAALAQHFGEAAPLGAGDKAVHYLIAAGAVALESLAFDEAVVRFTQALDIIADVGLDAPDAHAEASIGLRIARRMTLVRGHDAALRSAVHRAVDQASAISAYFQGSERHRRQANELPVVASRNRRIAAGAIDLLLIAIGSYVLSQLFNALGVPVAGWQVFIMVDWMVVVVPMATTGRPPGARAVGTTVVALVGHQPPGWAMSALRWLVARLPLLAGAVVIVAGAPDSSIPMLLVAEAVGLSAIYFGVFFDPLGQGLHDRAARTIVVAASSPGY